MLKHLISAQSELRYVDFKFKKVKNILLYLFICFGVNMICMYIMGMSFIELILLKFQYDLESSIEKKVLSNMYVEI